MLRCMGRILGKRAFVSGICGQIGSYLAEQLLSAGYIVHGLVRRSSTIARPRIDHLQSNPNLHLHYGDVLDSGCLHRLFAEIQPHEIFHLAAQSLVPVSFSCPDYTGEVDFIGTLRMLEAFRNVCPQARFYNSGSSEMFGSSPPPQNENTPMHPQSPYGAAKLASYWATRQYREAYGLFACSGILFNSESPRRGESFVTRKITRGVARIAVGLDRGPIKLGNLSAMRDWMHAKDAARGMWLTLQQEKPDDFVLATGRDVTVQWFVREAAKAAGLEFHAQPPWNPESGWFSYPVLIDGETVYAKMSGNQVCGLVDSDHAYYRPLEVNHLCGDSARARQLLNWQPTVTLEELVREMVESDLVEAKREFGKT
jgi:GDPmannose 4,6-dehydratase